MSFNSANVYLLVFDTNDWIDGCIYYSIWKKSIIFLWLLEKDVRFKCWMSTADCLAFPEDDNADNGNYDWWATWKEKDYR